MQCTIDDRLSGLSKISQRKLVEIFEKIPGAKDFIIDVPLIKPLERIVSASFLRSHGVDKFYKLESTEIPRTNLQRVFFIPSDLITLKRVCDKINSELREKSNEGNSYHVVFAGRKLGCLSSLLEEEGIHGSVTSHAFQWELIQIDTRVFSMEYPGVFRSLFVDGDHSSLLCLAKSIWSLQLLLGKPWVTVVQGKHSHAVERMVELLNEESGRSERPEPALSCFVIVDRDVDYASSLLTGATYSSLLDEVYGIETGVVDVQGSARSLNSSEAIYSEIKSRHFADVYPFLSSKIKELSLEASRSKSMALDEMRRFISNELQSIPVLKKSLAFHIEACEGVINRIGHKFEGLQTTEGDILEGKNRGETMGYIEDSLVTSSDRRGPLRLMCLASVAQDGLLSDEASGLKSQFLHAHGYHHLPALYRLEKAGLLGEQPAIINSEVRGGAIANRVARAVSLPARRSAFYSTSLKLRLFPPSSSDSSSSSSSDLKSPRDPGYVFSGSYVPLVTRLVDLIIKRESPLDEILKLVPNASFKTFGPSASTRPLRSFLVYFVGGVTYAEISAFQLLERLTGTDIVVAGTTITNGNLLVESCF